MIRQVLAANLEEALAQAHNEIASELIIESLIKNGNVNIEEAQFFNKLAGEILHESSHLAVPTAEEIIEEMEGMDDGIGEDMPSKILVDPETGEKYIYDAGTGELTPADDDVEADEDVEDAEDDVDDAEYDMDDADEDMADADEDLENADEDLENAEDVSAADAFNESTEIQESTTPQILTENELLVEKLLNTLRN